MRKQKRKLTGSLNKQDVKNSVAQLRNYKKMVNKIKNTQKWLRTSKTQKIVDNFENT
jgi:hypothetical protein